jgi:hypothetical protein
MCGKLATFSLVAITFLCSCCHIRPSHTAQNLSKFNISLTLFPLLHVLLLRLWSFIRRNACSHLHLWLLSKKKHVLAWNNTKRRKWFNEKLVLKSVNQNFSWFFLSITKIVPTAKSKQLFPPPFIQYSDVWPLASLTWTLTLDFHNVTLRRFWAV